MRECATRVRHGGQLGREHELDAERRTRAALDTRRALRVRRRARSARPRLEVARPGRAAPRAWHRHLRPAQRMGGRQVCCFTRPLFILLHVHSLFTIANASYPFNNFIHLMLKYFLLIF